MSVAEIALSLYAANEGYLDSLPLNKILPFEAGMHQFFRNSYKDLMVAMDKSGDWDKEIEAKFQAGITEFKKTGSY